MKPAAMARVIEAAERAVASKSRKSGKMQTYADVSDAFADVCRRMQTRSGQ
jgi:hypothetical protein